MIPDKRHVAAVCHDGHIRLVEQDIPALRSGMVLVDVRASLVSPGTELGGWSRLAAMRETPDDPAEPRPFGYSNAGVVIAVGDDVEGFEPSQRVACIGAGYAVHGDYAVVPHHLCFAIPDEVTFAEGAYAMLAATGLHAVRRLEPQLGEYAAVLGLGLVGQLTAQLLQRSGVEVIGWDAMDRRLDIARDWGITQAVNIRSEDPYCVTRAFTDQAGLDAAVIAFGGDATKAYQQVVQSLKVSPDGHSMGRVVIVGGVSFPIEWIPANHDIRFAGRTGPGYHDEDWETGKDYPSVFMRWTTRTNVELCLRMIKEQRLDVDALTTHTVSLENVDEEVSAMIETPESILGVIISMSDE